MNAPRGLRDQRRTEAREALYRAQLRRDQIIDSLLRNADRINKLKRKLARLEIKPANKVPVSVAEGRLLEDITVAVSGLLNDDISDVPPCK